MAKFNGVVGLTIPGVDLLHIGKIEVIDRCNDRGEEAGVVGGDDGLGIRGLEKMRVDEE